MLLLLRSLLCLSILVLTLPAQQAKAQLLYEDFSGCGTSLPEGWTAYNAVGAQVWRCTSAGSSGSGIEINGFANNTHNLNEDWLISPAMDLNQLQTPSLTFQAYTRFSGPAIRVMASTDYPGTGDPRGFTWVQLPATLPASNSDTWTLSPNTDLTAVKSRSSYVAFVYTSSSATRAALWRLDDILVDEPTAAVRTNLQPLQDFHFGYVAPGTQSTSRTFRFTASALTALNLQAPAGFELSKDNSTFSSQLQYSATELSNEKTAYIRFAPTTGISTAWAGGITFSAPDFRQKYGYFSGSSLQATNSLDIATWNIEWFGASGYGPTNTSLQAENVKRMIDFIDADLIALQEIADLDAFYALVNDLPGYKGFHSPFTSGGSGTKQHLAFLYRTSVLDSVSARAMLLSPFNPSNFWSSGRMPYLFVANATVQGQTRQIHFINIHAKANESGSTAQFAYDRRLRDVNVLKDTLDLHYANTPLVLLGDYNDDVDYTVANISSTLSSYHRFTEDTLRYRIATRPLSDAGLRSYITLDNVIDHIAVSDELFEDHLPESSRIVIPFNLIPDFRTTTSDHMPVKTRLQFKVPLSAPQARTMGISVYPNPTQGTVHINTATAEAIQAALYSLDGRLLMQAQGSAEGASHLLSGYLSTEKKGMYLLRLQQGNEIKIIKIIKL
jgi:trimeric autotransporter adhesin